MNQINNQNKRSNGKAVVALILGLMSITLMRFPLFGLIVGIIGLTVSMIAWHEVKRSRQWGKKLAAAGVIFSSIGILLPLVLAIAGGLALLS